MRAGRRQRGVVLIAMLAIIAIGATWFLLSKLNAESANVTAAVRNRNAIVLNRAKQALIGYVAAQAAKDGENNPGNLPCPENPADFNSAIGNDGKTGSGCGTSLKVGRFPWRTIGTDELVDAYGEPLWYVVSTNWGVPSGSNSVINSNSMGQLTVDGVANSAVALIIAPGPAISVAAAAGCTAWTQTRPTTAPPDWRNYLECENATNPADSVFVTTGPSGSFNDQVLKITTADLLPAIEAGIAARIEREIAPVLKSMYNGGSWSGSSSTPWLPFAAPFGNPATSAMQGVSGTLQGILPLTYSETSPGSGTLCTVGPNPRCNPNFVAWTGTPTMVGGASPSCVQTGTQIDCTYYRTCFLFCFSGGTANFTLTAAAANVGMALRQFNTAVAMTNVNAAGRTATGVLSADGSATITLAATATQSSGAGFGGALGNLLCGLLGFLQVCKAETFSVPISLLADHTLLDSTTTGSGATGWFMRNKWHEVTYYAMAGGFAPGGARSCTTGSTCLTVNYHRSTSGTDDSGTKRAILILSGRTLTGAARPNGTLSDWLEGANADGTSPFEIRSSTLIPNKTFNDRVAVIDTN